MDTLQNLPHPKEMRRLLFLTSGCTNYYLASDFVLFHRGSGRAANKPEHLKSLPILGQVFTGLTIHFGSSWFNWLKPTEQRG